MYLTQSLHRAVQQHPQRIAVRCGARQHSFQAFGDRVARLAGALQQLGMQDGDRVAMLALNSDRYLEYQMAVPWGGGVMNPCNIRWSAAEILYALDDSGSTILLVDDTFRPMVEQFRGDARTLREVIYCGDGPVPDGMHGYEALIAATAPVPDAVRRGDDLAGIFYTGGTTGFPKGVMLSHRNLAAMMGMIRSQVDAGTLTSYQTISASVNWMWDQLTAGRVAAWKPTKDLIGQRLAALGQQGAQPEEYSGFFADAADGFEASIPLSDDLADRPQRINIETLMKLFEFFIKYILPFIIK
jgi:acyl-CoA synthetase (AMP-forming)/AMP-acid ligase II